MKKIFLLISLGLLALTAQSQITDSIPSSMQEQSPQQTITLADSLSLELLQQIADQTVVPRYKIYKTENMYNLLKLDTRLGQVWMVQYGIKGSSEPMTIAIDDEVLWGYKAESGYNGRFELYPTNNTYNFILLDTYNGYTYQVQWYVNDANKRFVRRIY